MSLRFVGSVQDDWGFGAEQVLVGEAIADGSIEASAVTMDVHGNSLHSDVEKESESTSRCLRSSSALCVGESFMDRLVLICDSGAASTAGAGFRVIVAAVP